MRPLIVLLVLTAAACTQGDAKQGEKKAPPALAVSVVNVQPRQVPVSFDAVGRTEGSREVQVRARVSGILEKQLYTEGDSVKAGAVLFQIERAPFEIELASAKGALGQEVARLDLAMKEAERLKTLADRRAISQKEADQAASALGQSTAAVEVAKARVRQAELNLSYTTVAAQISGITGRAQQSIGSLVSPTSESAMLTTLTRGDPLWVRFSLSEPEYATVRGSETKDIQIKLETADGKPYAQEARINFAGSAVDAATGTVQMRAEVANPELALLPGQFVRVRVIAGSRQAIVVPQTAVMQNEGGRFVWLMGPDGKAVQRPIRAGSWLGSDWIVLDGLKPGDAVITDNLVRLRPGAPVAPAKKG
jgi:membrane fusion protein, multidrug efflux system